MRKNNLLNLDQARQAIASTQLISRILAFAPGDLEWEQATAEGTIEELQRAYDRCPNKELWGVVELKKRLDAKLNAQNPGE